MRHRLEINEARRLNHAHYRCCISEDANPVGIPFESIFRVEQLTADAFLLTWDPWPLTKHGVTTLRVNAKRTHIPDSVKSRVASVQEVEAAFKVLYPNTLYTVDVIASGDGGVIFTYQTFVRTLPTGKFFLDPSYRISLHSCVETPIAKLKWVLKMLVGVVLAQCQRLRH
ncbi:Phosphatidylinositol phosphatase PTPRQ, partial [Taenia solium]